MFTISLQGLLFNLVGLLLVATLVGWWRGWLAVRLGMLYRNQQPALNPADSLSLGALVAGLLFGVGWVRSPWFHTGLLQPTGRLALWLILSWLSYLPLALMAHLAERLVATSLGGEVGFTLSAFFGQLSSNVLWFMLLGLFPFFPLELSYVLGSVWPKVFAWFQARALWADVLPLALLATGLAKALLLPLHQSMVGLLGRF